MSAWDHGQGDTDVLRHLRQFGLHPAVRVFESKMASNWAQESIETILRSAEHPPILRLVFGTRTA